eukprot:Hpha_TRINITY_DN30822_c0_g1::TRINITY_DN30822_c0_g1_i1::g.155590::m.155590
MKLLDVGGLSSMNASLDRVECCGSVVTCRVDAHSCKKIQSDKRLTKHVQNRAQNSPDVTDPAFLPPPGTLGGESPSELPGRRLGPKEAEVAANLISTINMAFPDHDFSDVLPWSFRREEASAVRKTIDEKLSEPMALLKETGNTLSTDSFWFQVQKVVENFDACQFFSFQPGSADSPFDDVLWAHYFFIFNAGISKLVFVHLHASPDNETSIASPRAAGRAASRSSEGGHSPLSTRGGPEEFQVPTVEDNVLEPPPTPVPQPAGPAPSPLRRRPRAADEAGPAAAKRPRQAAE